MSILSHHTCPNLLKQWDSEARQHEKRVYFNKPQLMAQYIGAKMTVIVDGRRTGSSNSLTLSWLLIDEAKFIDYNKLNDETLPANGGIRSYFGHHSFNHAMMVLSDMPLTQKGSCQILSMVSLKASTYFSHSPFGSEQHAHHIRATMLSMIYQRRDCPSCDILICRN